MLKVAYLGPEGSFTEIAAKKFYFDKVNYLPISSITDVIKTVDSGSDTIGVVPIENSIEGIVRETVDNLLTVKTDIFITGEIVLPIKQALISRADSISQVKVLVSYTQGFAQCRQFISDHLNNVRILHASSTSEAVRQIVTLDETHAAIGNVLAAKKYGLNVLCDEINDVKTNQTKFISIGRVTCKQTGNDKSFIVFSTENRSGDLVKVLDVFDNYNINLSYIESRPSKIKFGEYNFFVNFDGHIEDEKVKEAINKIKGLISFYKFLGSYPSFTANS